MRQTKLLFALLIAACQVHAQCLTAPMLSMCSGTETLTANSDVINVSETRYFYGSTTTLSNIKLNGGMLVVCGNLTINDLVFDSGTIYVQPLASLVVSNGAGLVLRGNSAIYNRGSFQCLGNIVMDGTYATAAKPNVIINAVSNAQWKMANQYFVINNPNSWFVNNGIADFHGIITDYNSSQGSVCLGFNSQTRMTVLYNRMKNTYVAPNGPACVSVSQYSQFYDTLTNFPSVNVCLGNLHNSDASCVPWGCRPNAWGAAQVTVGCVSCSSVLTFLPVNNNGQSPNRELRRNEKAGTPYPNPFTKAVNISLPSTSKPTIIVTDISGRALNNYAVMIREKNLQLSFEQLSAGIYFIRVVQDGKETVHKVWKR